MKELDLLKKDWQKKATSFEQLSEKDIYALIHKQSASVVKWILIVSILEFVVLNGIGFLLPDDRSNKMLGKLEFYLNAEVYLNYCITLGFVYLFYKNYKSIQVIYSTKKLAESILKTRKTVAYYIGYTLVHTAIIIILITGYFVYNTSILKTGSLLNSEKIIAVVLIAVAFIIGIVWGFYQLLYGFLLKKLKKNYEELQKIDS